MIFPGLTTGAQTLQSKSASTVSLFNRVAVENPETLFYASLIEDKEPLLFDDLTATGGTATHDTNGSCVNMAVTDSVGSRVVRQSFRYIPYQPGKTFQVLCTGTLQTAITTGVRSRIGLFDNHSDKSVDSGGDGAFFEHDGTACKVVIRSYVTGSQVDNAVSQSNWNLDKMDGTGPSGLTVDWTKRQIFVIVMQWLGVGSVLFALSINGKLWPVHQFDHSNVTDSKPYMRRATLPIRYEIENVSSTSAATMRQVCCAVSSGGGFNPRGKIFTHRRSNASLSTSNETFLMAIRLGSGYTRRTINPIGINAINTTNGGVIIRAYLYATLTNATFAESFVGSSFAGAEIDTAASAFSTTNAVYITDNAFTDDSNSLITRFENTLVLAADIAGTADILVITGQRLTAQSETVSVSLQWQEY